MYEEEFFGICFHREIQQFFATGVAGEVKVFDETIELDLVGAIEADHVTC